jgi:formylglycine-generating enzyme required for sulfatase activity
MPCQSGLGREPTASGKGIAPSLADLALQFPQLQIIGLLGIGGRGVVYTVRLPQLDRLAALKVLCFQFSRDPSSWFRVENLQDSNECAMRQSQFFMKTKLHNLFITLTLFASVHPILAQTIPLGIAATGNQAILFWPTSATNYALQSTTNLGSPNWVTVTNAVPVMAVTVSDTSPETFFRLYQPVIPAGMAFIPAGAFIMGDTLDGETDAPPTIVTVSAFFMDTNLVSYSQWQTVYHYATNLGYGFSFPGSGKAANHPVYFEDWYDVVKWSNARSQQAGLTPVYYTDAGLRQVYKSGEVTPYVNWGATGYRLPTEAEWEKAARGGLTGYRFPWGNTISESQANYYGCTTCYTYDFGPNGYNATFTNGAQPYTSPVGYFPPNGYGLCDMAGNVSEWCWDWYGTPYIGGTDPHGPAFGSYRVLRGGDWDYGVSDPRCAFRDNYGPTFGQNYIGFRCGRGI